MPEPDARDLKGAESSEPPWESCPKCIDHYYGNPSLVHAFASVGIEHGKSTFEMAESYFARYHRVGHRAIEALDV
jgi:hypothetical protein